MKLTRSPDKELETVSRHHVHRRKKLQGEKADDQGFQENIVRKGCQTPQFGYATLFHDRGAAARRCYMPAPRSRDRPEDRGACALKSRLRLHMRRVDLHVRLTQ